MNYLSLAVFILSCFVVALAQPSSEYTITYTGYTDNRCQAVNHAVTGEIFAYTCAPEFDSSQRSGKITEIDDDKLTSCDYTDNACQNQWFCEVYSNNNCMDRSPNSAIPYSQKYSWTWVDGMRLITFTDYNNNNCTANATVTSQFYPMVCGAEYDRAPRSGMITYIDGHYLTSCDYSDVKCTNLVLCENYTNSVCYASTVEQFSNVYSWTMKTPTSAPSTDTPSTSAPATSAPEPTSAPNGDYVITYTGYTDNHCAQVDNSVTGQIFAHTCAPEYKNSARSGMITQIDETHLVSCDYSDTTCQTSIGCETYARDTCMDRSPSATVAYSQKYAWVKNSHGKYVITFTDYNNRDCSGASNVASIFMEMTCGEEYTRTPTSGMLTYIDDDYLTSCDYSDTACKTLVLCENYTNSLCYGSKVVEFSNKYSWYRKAGSAGSNTPAPSVTGNAGHTVTGESTNPQDPPKNGNSADWEIAYAGYTDNHCGEFDFSVTGQIFAYTCAPEFRKEARSGKIVYVTDQYLTSCDYSDKNCSVQTVCENYNNDECYGSGDLDFSNKYTWAPASNGQYVIWYRSYSDKKCASTADIVSEIHEGVCGLEYETAPQTGMITYIDDDVLTSCDYSDLYCQDMILCENYTNLQCYGSEVTSFSNRYAWRRASAATVVSASVVLALLAAFFILF